MSAELLISVPRSCPDAGCEDPSFRTATDRSGVPDIPPYISAAKNDPRNQRVILSRKAGKTIRASKIPAIDGRDECRFLNLP